MEEWLFCFLFGGFLACRIYLCTWLVAGCCLTFMRKVDRWGGYGNGAYTCMLGVDTYAGKGRFRTGYPRAARNSRICVGLD